jgi:hypothetical protein
VKEKEQSPSLLAETDEKKETFRQDILTGETVSKGSHFQYNQQDLFLFYFGTLLKRLDASFDHRCNQV